MKNLCPYQETKRMHDLDTGLFHIEYHSKYQEKVSKVGALLFAPNNRSYVYNLNVWCTLKIFILREKKENIHSRRCALW